ARPAPLAPPRPCRAPSSTRSATSASGTSTCRRRRSGCGQRSPKPGTAREGNDDRQRRRVHGGSRGRPWEGGEAMATFVLVHGDSLTTLTAAASAAPAVGPGSSWLVPPMARDFDDPAEAAWSAARRTPQPAGCFSEPVRLARPLEDFPLTRTYIKASAEPRTQPPSPFWAAADRAKASPAWRYRELDTTHMIPSNRPGDLTRLLAELT